MKYFERVTVALRLDPVDEDLLRYGRLLRDLAEGPIRFAFVHVLSPVDAWNHAGAPPPSLAEVRSALHAAVRKDFDEVEPEAVHVLTGSHIDKLLASVAEAGSDLLLVGHRRNARGRRSSSRRLAMKAPCSVWMVPEGSPARITRVLAAADFSQASAHAVSLATLIARRAGGAPCSVLHVLQPHSSGYDAVERSEAARAFAAFLAPLDLHGVEVRTLLEESGSVAGAVTHQIAAEGADLVVAGTRGRSLSAAILLGSESEHLLLDSTVPVLVTKDRGERIGILRALLDRDFRTAEPQFG